MNHIYIILIHSKCENVRIPVLGLEKRKWEDGHLVQSMFLFLTLITTTFETDAACIDIQYTWNAYVG